MQRSTKPSDTGGNAFCKYKFLGTGAGDCKARYLSTQAFTSVILLARMFVMRNRGNQFCSFPTLEIKHSQQTQVPLCHRTTAYNVKLSLNKFERVLKYGTYVLKLFSILCEDAQEQGHLDQTSDFHFFGPFYADTPQKMDESAPKLLTSKFPRGKKNCQDHFVSKLYLIVFSLVLESGNERATLICQPYRILVCSRNTQVTFVRFFTLSAKCSVVFVEQSHVRFVFCLAFVYS